VSVEGSSSTTSLRRTLTVGGSSADELLLRLTRDKVDLNAYAALLFAHSPFWEPTTPRQLTVVTASAATLGCDGGAVLADVLRAAEARGLTACPMDLAPWLRLAWMDQPDASKVTVACEPPFSDPAYPTGWYLGREGERRWLRGYRASSDWWWRPDSVFAFVADDD